MRIDVAPAISIVRHRCTPSRRVRVAALDVSRDIARGEEPDFDAGAGPKRGVDAAAVCVERRAEGNGVVGGDAAAVEAAACAAVAGETRAGFTARANARVAARRGVEGDLVDVGEVDAFVDVDFALVGPVGADHPAVGDGELAMCGSDILESMGKWR